jgi:hypothetical protein
MRLPVGLIKTLIGAGPSIKSAIFSDGKFKQKRAVILLVGFVLITGSMYFFGADNTEMAIDLLDDLSDSMGYAE